MRYQFNRICDFCEKPYSGKGKRYCSYGCANSNNKYNYLKGELAKLSDDPSLPWSSYPCLLWPFCIGPDGYGLVRCEGGSKLVPRVAFVEAFGPLPPGGRVSLMCGNRRCFRPTHLSAREGNAEYLQAVLGGLTDDLSAPWDSYPCIPWPFGKNKGKVEYGAVAWQGSTIGTHVLAYTLTFGPLPNGKVVCHRCDFGLCFRPMHLWPGSLVENNADCKTKGRNARGENHNFAKLTEAQALDIRRLFAGGKSETLLAPLFSVTPATIKHIVTRFTWRHI